MWANIAGQKRHQYQKSVRGFSGFFHPADAQSLSTDARVAYVEEDGVARGSNVQTNADWNLDRIDQHSLPLDSQYFYDYSGAGTRIYVIDSGIRATHQEFGGRAVGEVTFVNDGNGTADCANHGTAVASLAAGASLGVAKGSLVRAVRVLDCANTAPWSVIIAGIDYVAANHVKPAVANFSIGGSTSFAADTAIRNLINAGVLVVGAAGNDSSNACFFTPGSVSEALIVGNSTRYDWPSDESNYGACVDLYAPGTDVFGAYKYADYAWMTYTGTSFAAPQVTGTAAVYLQTHPTATPAEVTSAILATATQNALTNVPAGTPNRLLYARALTESTLPTVALTAPANNATVSGMVTISANASDNEQVVKVTFFLDDVVIGAATTAPYSMLWDTSASAPGSHELRAFAEDYAGNQMVSSIHTVTVTVASSNPTNVVADGDFESNPAIYPDQNPGLLKWTTDREVAGTVDYMDYDTHWGQPKTGSRSGSCWTNGGGDCSLIQHINVPSAGSYKVSFWAKAGIAGAWAGLNINDVDTWGNELPIKTWGPHNWNGDSSTEFEYYEYATRNLAAGTKLSVWLYHPNRAPSQDNWTVIDDVSIVKLP